MAVLRGAFSVAHRDWETMWGMPTYRDQAVVLRTHKLGEADRIVSMLSREHGKIRAVARGVRRTSSKFGARLDPFNLVDLQLVQGRNLDVVAQVECLHPYSAPLRQDYGLFTAAEVMVEAADHLVPVDREPAPAQYRLLAGALRVLGRGTADGPRPPEMVLDSYLLRSLSASGYAPDLVDCVRCGAPGPHPGFSPSLGGVVCINCQPPGTPHPHAETIAYLQALLVGDWPATREVTWPRIREGSGLVAAFVSWHMDRGLRSMPFLER